MESPITTADKAVAMTAVSLGLLGLLTNGIVAYCAVRNADLRRKDYIRLIANRALLDFVLCCSFICLQPLGLLASSSRTSGWCSVAAFCSLALASASIYSELAIGGLRFCAIFHKNLHNHLNHPWYINVICICLWLMGLIAALPHPFIGSLGSMPGFLCSVTFRDRWSVIWIMSWNYTPLLFSLTSVAILNFKAFRFIRKHQNQQTTSEMRSRLQSDKEILMFVTVTGLTPFVVDGPVLLATIIFSYDPTIVSEWSLFVCISFYLLSPAINPIISVLMIKPLKKEFLSFYRDRLVGCICAIINRKHIITATTMVTSIDQDRNNHQNTNFGVVTGTDQAQ